MNFKLRAPWIFCSFVVFILNFGCASREVNSHGLEIMTETQFNEILDDSTRHEQIYSGLYNAVDIFGTVLNSRVRMAQLDQSARLYQWDSAKFSDEKKKSEESLNKESEFFVSLYTPERKHDDLHKNKTLWKIFLDANGKRYEGTATKIKLLTSEVQGLFPTHNRFSTPYSIKFNVSMTSIEHQPLHFILTGPVGSVKMEFSRP